MCSLHNHISVFAYLLPFLLIIILNTTHQASSSESLYYICPNTTTYSPNSIYKTNLQTLLSTLSSSNTTGDKIFYNSTATSRLSSDTVYGLYLCRGDSTSEVCHDCVVNAAKEIVTHCPKQKVAVIWYPECMLRYSDQYIFSTLDDRSTVYMWNIQNITDVVRFNKLLGDTMKALATEASSSSNSQVVKGFATGNANFTSFQSLYGLVQCTPDLPGLDCDRCLQGAISLLPRCCDGKQGGRVLNPSCNIRYEIYPFFNSLPIAPAPSPIMITSPPRLPIPSPSSLTRPKGKGGVSSQALIAIITPICGSLLIFGIGYCYIIKRAKRNMNVWHQTNAEDEITNVESLQFDFGTVEEATSNFSTKIGQGGFGEVFKGVLKSGQEIAVKRLSKHSGQGLQEFKNEVVLVAKLQHRNLARLLGFCLEGVEKILIYEYIPNKSLDCFLFDPKRRTQLDWSRRYQIIGGIAKGLTYLHEDSQLRIVHRDLKASNILLDADMNAKISDFGMAKLFGVDETHGSTNRIVGTFGYMSPEYAMHGQYSLKSDVFSFGVLVLEIISGRKNTNLSDNAEDLLCQAWRLWKNNTPLEIVDPTLVEPYSRNEVSRCINIGLLCVQEDAAARPSMDSVLMMLTSYTVSMGLPQQPPFFANSRTEYKPPEGFKSDQSTSYSTPSVDGDSITGIYPR